ncbi:MAG: twin-arginine translocation signal domain-containing protein, partial [Muribaculaceae bacterium]|nr:twin-arginine translocation signal domain-containing protein [Muribaculaceae bacterium]
MNRRNFLRTSILGAAAVAVAPMSFSAPGMATKPANPTGKLKLTFEPYELQLRHAFNLAKYQRTTTPGVQVRLECDGITVYG